jgi:feruloyl esterase
VSKFYRPYMFPGVYDCAAVYPYPEQVKYSGTGDPNLAASYAGYLPGVRHQDDFEWAGYPFRSGYEEWCQLSGNGGALVCAREGEEGA